MINKIYVSNAFSLQMLQAEEVKVSIAKKSATEVADFLKDKDYISCVGHQDTANVVENILKLPVPYNSQAICLQQGDILIVAQVVGGRLPEGATKLPEGMQIVFYEVKIDS